jgi:hypothetical protein
MAHNFDSRAFVRDVAHDLISNFDRAAKATTPGLKGAARENEVRRKLESLLPTGVGVGTGCVIDHEGMASRQQDVILYEKNICPVFSINETPESTYYPCEGVIAVGEIKTSLGKSEIEDCFSKIKSVKSLNRLALKSKSGFDGSEIIAFRNYGNPIGFDCTPSEQFDQKNNPYDQIYGFVLCGDFSVTVDTLCTHISNQLKVTDKYHCPNIIVSLSKGIFAPYQKSTNNLRYSLSQADNLLYGSTESGSFEYLLTKLHQTILLGRTADSRVFERYLISNPDKMTLAIDRIVE